MYGWEPREFVSYIREAGEIVGHVVSREPEWSREDVRLMLAQMVWEQSLDANGIPLDDALQGNPDDRSGDWFWRAGVRVVDPETKKVLYAPDVNYAEKVKQDALDRLRQANPEANLNGLFFRLERVERTKR